MKWLPPIIAESRIYRLAYDLDIFILCWHYNLMVIVAANSQSTTYWYTSVINL